MAESTAVKPLIRSGMTGPRPVTSSVASCENTVISPVSAVLIDPSFIMRLQGGEERLQPGCQAATPIESA